MMTAHTPQGRRKTPSPPNQSTPMDKKSTYKKKENIMRSLPPQRYDVTEQNDDVTDGILGGRLLRIELWNMK